MASRSPAQASNASGAARLAAVFFGLTADACWRPRDPPILEAWSRETIETLAGFGRARIEEDWAPLPQQG